MPRYLSIAALTFFLLGCRLPPEREPLKPLPEEAVFSYIELSERARAQVSAALDAYYLDAWKEVEEAANGLEQTARFLPKASDPPAHLKATLLPQTKEMRAESAKLAEAARAKSAERCNQSLQRLIEIVRAIRHVEKTKDKD